MGTFAGRASSNFFKMTVTLAGLAVLFYILIEFRLWSMEWTDYFLKRGNWEEIIFVSLIVFLISTVAIKLFQWHIRMQARGR